MTIKIKIEKLGDAGRGHQLRMQYHRRRMSRGRAAAVLGVSVVRLWLLEEGEADMESPEMWDRALEAIRKAAAPAAPQKQAGHAFVEAGWPEPLGMTCGVSGCGRNALDPIHTGAKP